MNFFIVFKPLTIRLINTPLERVIDIDVGHIQIGHWKGALFALYIFKFNSGTVYKDWDILYSQRVLRGIGRSIKSLWW